MSIRILHTNDFHGKLTPELTAQLMPPRGSADLYFDCGDCIKAGNLAIPLKPDPCWERLAELDCSASVPGNRESHVLEAAFRMKLAGAKHPILCANLEDRKGGRPLASSIILEAKGIKVGVFGVMVPMVTAKMKTQAASAYLWQAPIPVGKRVVQEMRGQVDLLIALTHIGFAQDRALAADAPEIDLIIGGHSHTVLDQPVMVGRTAIVQAGSHGRYAGLFDFEPGAGIVRYELLSLAR